MCADVPVSTASATLETCPRICFSDAPNALDSKAVRKSPWDYYGELLGGCGGEPRLADLTELHDFYQKTAVHWDQQAEILFGKQTWSAWVVRSVKAYVETHFDHYQGSLLKSSVYLKSLDAFSNLQILIIGYPAPDRGTQYIRHTVAKDYSIGLGRYLAQTPQNLRTLYLTPVSISHLATITSTILQDRKHRSLFITSLALDMCEELDTKADNNTNSQVYSRTGENISQFLELMPHLQSIWIKYEDENVPLLLRPFNPPHLPQLTDLHLIGLALEPTSLRSLTVGNAASLVNLRLNDIHLISGTWASIFQAFATDLVHITRANGVCSPRYTGPTRIGAPFVGSGLFSTVSDRKAQLAWEDAIGVRREVEGLEPLRDSERVWPLNQRNQWIGE